MSSPEVIAPCRTSAAEGLGRRHPGPGYLLLTLWLALVVADAAAQDSKVIVLHNADSLVGRVINGEDARLLIGHVRVSQGSVNIWCDSAIEFRSRARLDLEGNVLVRDGAMTLTAPRAVYYREERRAEGFEDVALSDGRVRLTAEYGQYLVDRKIGTFRSRVTVVDSTSRVTADSVTYFRDTRRSIALGHVHVIDSSNNVVIAGGRLDHDQAARFSRMTLQPVLVQVDSGAAGRMDTLVVRSRVMEVYRDTPRRFVAIDSVRMTRADLAGLAGYVLFFTQGDSMLLRRSPVVWYERTQVSGDSINVYLMQRRLDRVWVTGSAFAVSQSDSLFPERLDQVTGESMLLRFENRALKELHVDVQAVSVYHLYEDSLANGLNKSSGDRIIMRFASGKLRDIRIIGGVEGQYVPENMVRGREREYAIPGMIWRRDRPRLVPSL